MPTIIKVLKKDLGQEMEVEVALPYADVGDSREGSLLAPIGAMNWWTMLTHIVPTGLQLKVLFLRVWTQNAGGAIFSIVQTNPTAIGQTGTTEAFPVRGKVPPFTAGLSAVRDYPMLEAAGAEVLHGSLDAPILVGEGSIDFRLQGPTPIPAQGARYGISWWGVQVNPPPEYATTI